MPGHWPWERHGARATPPRPLASRAARLLDRALDTALGASVLIAALTVLAQVVLRYGFNSPITWGDELAVLVFAWTVFIGAAVVQRDDSHLSMDSFVRLLPPRVGFALYLVRVAAMAAVLGVLFVQGWVLAERFSGKYYRAFTLGHEIDEANAQARYVDGVLELTLPKSPDSMPRKIAVH